jgi:hypothetical protein
MRPVKSAHLLASTGLHLEVRRDITSKDPSFKGFNVTSNICLRGQKMPLICHTMRIFMSIRHNDMSLICLDLPVSRNLGMSLP